jgi:hypothetical protein
MDDFITYGHEYVLRFSNIVKSITSFEALFAKPQSVALLIIKSLTMEMCQRRNPQTQVEL